MNQLIALINSLVTLTGEETEKLLSLSKQKSLDRNETFMKQGERCTKLAFLLTGSFRCFYTTTDGEEVNTEFIITEGFITDFISYSRKAESQVSIQALEKSNIIVIDFHSLTIGNELRAKLRVLSTRYINKVCLPVLRDYQLIMAENASHRYELLAQKYPYYLQRIPQKHIASYLRLRPETISRIRKKFLDLNQLVA